MPKLTGPLFSLSASGSLAKTLVFAKWKGVQYARQHVVPQNPDTVDQRAVRQVFKNMSAVYALLGADATQSWKNAALGLPLTERNVFVRDGLLLLLNAMAWDSFPVLKPFQGLGLLATAPVVAGNDLLEVTPTFPTIPSGWTVTGAISVAVFDQDPTSAQDWDPAAVATKYSATGTGVMYQITGLKSAETYQVSTILLLHGPTFATDGIERYSNVLLSSQTTT